MKAFQMELPPEVSEDEARLLLAIKLYELGRLSLGQSAKLAGYSKRAFIELLGKYGVPVVAYSPEELRGEVQAECWLYHHHNPPCNSAHPAKPSVRSRCPFPGCDK
jgi:predicted HTH domain antitoxin